MEPLDSDTIIRMLVNIATHQLAITQDIRAVFQEQRAINERWSRCCVGRSPPSPNGH